MAISLVPSQPRRVEKPWGYELIWAHTERYVGKILHIEAGQSLSLQFHQKKDETIYLLSGRMRFEFFRDGEAKQEIELSAGQSFHITTGLRHRMSAIETCEVAEASTPELDDVVRLEDRYGR